MAISGSLTGYTGLPTGRKKTRRGPRKASAKPGASLLHALTQAHQAGNYAQAKTHALNFANALHQHLSGAAPSGAGPSLASDTLDPGASASPMTPTPSPTAGGPSVPQSGVTNDPPGPNSDHWIAGAIQHPGALHRELGVPQGQKIPAKKIAAAAHSSNPVEARRARLAQTLKGLRK